MDSRSGGQDQHENQQGENALRIFLEQYKQYDKKNIKVLDHGGGFSRPGRRKIDFHLGLIGHQRSQNQNQVPAYHKDRNPLRDQAGNRKGNKRREEEKVVGDRIEIGS